MKEFCSLFLLLLLYSNLTGQTLNEIIQSEQTFSQITKAASSYFAQKFPGKTHTNLIQGTYRDEAYFEYQKWKNYWSYNQAGLGQLEYSETFHRRNKQRFSSERQTGTFANIVWTNISNENVLAPQVGLGRTTSLAFHPSNPDIFYVGTARGGIWGTNDGGQSYSPLGDDLPSLAISSIAVDQQNPSTLYIAISDHLWFGLPGLGIYKSTDGGISWQTTVLSIDASEDQRIYKIIQHPTTPNTFFVATQKGLYKTTDGFQSVTLINDKDTYDICFNSNNPAILFQATTNGEILKSTDTGNSFISITSLLGNGTLVRLSTNPQNNNIIYAVKGNRLYRSTNGGNSFSFVQNLNNKNPILITDPQNPNVILHGNFELFRSNDGGNNSFQIMDENGEGGLPAIHTDQRNAFINPLLPRRVFLCNDGGIYSYDWDDNSFSNLSNGLVITQFNDISVSQSDQEIISGGTVANGSIFRNSDGLWDFFPETGEGMRTAIDPENNILRYWSLPNGSLRRWANGFNFDITPEGEEGEGAWETPFVLDPNDADRIVVGYKKVYSSDKWGLNWVQISDELEPGIAIDELAIAPSNSERIYATQDKSLFVKNTQDNNWVKKTTPAPFKISDLAIDPIDFNTLYISVSGFSEGNKVFKSTDAGTSWINISGDLPNVPAMTLEIFNSVNDGLFVGTDAGIFYRDEIFSDWESYGELPNTRITDIEIQYEGALLRAATYGRGIYETNLPGSQPGCTEMTVTFFNFDLAEVDVFWDDNGALKLLDRIPKGSSIEREVLPGQRWIFKVNDITVGNYVAVCGIDQYAVKGCSFLGNTPCPVKLNLKIMLEGAYDPTNSLMNDELRQNGKLGMNDPYGVGQTMNSGLLNLSGENAIVEWVYIEIRTGSIPTQFVARQAALLQRDGDVIDAFGNTGVSFPDLPSGYYFVIINYRNHLALATASPIALNGNIGLDFSDPLFPVFGAEDAGKIIEGQRFIIAGDANGDGTINAVDKNARWKIENGLPYQINFTSADFNLDGAVNAIDKNGYWQLNNSKSELLPASAQ